MFVDLSQPIRTGMPVYPGDPEVSVESALSLSTDGVAVMEMRCGTHSGTHLDAPSHVIEGGRTVDEIPLEWLQGAAQVLRVRAGGGSQIDLGDLLGLPERLPRIICVATGWDRYFDEEVTLQHPYLGLECARELWARGARVLGVDAMSPDASAPECVEQGMPVHEFWLGHDGVIVENLAGLSELPDRVELSLFPLHVLGGDGAPVRAVART